MSRQKSKLAKLLRSDNDNVYETTEYACRYWFNILNKEIFNEQLTPVNEIDIRWRRLCYAFYEYEANKKSRSYGYSKIAMNKKYQSKKFFVNVLLHEMIHHYQALYDEPMGHGPSFEKWKEVAKQKGLKLV